jgi:homoserine O-succinyltransferase
LAGLIDWAADNTISTIYSCLAAHAAVLHIDGINRQALGNKLSGVFECVKASEHALVGATPQSWRVPHSRYNGLCENELISKGYHPVTCSQIAGLDSFVKQQGRSLFFFLQGHMEYGAEALLREYVRDITRYLKGERETYPCMPHSYFDQKTTEAFSKLREHALAGRDEQLLAKIAGTAAECKLLDPWRPVATSIYGNWLSYIAKQKSRTREAGHRRRRGLSAAM